MKFRELFDGYQADHVVLSSETLASTLDAVLERSPELSENKRIRIVGLPGLDHGRYHFELFLDRDGYLIAGHYDDITAGKSPVLETIRVEKDLAGAYQLIDKTETKPLIECIGAQRTIDIKRGYANGLKADDR